MKKSVVSLLALVTLLGADKIIKKRYHKPFYDRYIQKLENDRGVGGLDFRYRFTAQAAYDYGYIDSSYVDPNVYNYPNTKESIYSNQEFRRVRLGNKGSFFNKKLFYEAEYSFTGNNHYKDIYLGYKNKVKILGLKYRLKAGNIKVPFSLESYSSSKYNTFMENSLADTFYYSRKVGAELLLSEKFFNNYINLFGAVFTNSIDERIDAKPYTQLVSSRLTYAHKFSKTHLFEAGVSYAEHSMDNLEVQFKQESESDLIFHKFVSVKMQDVTNVSHKAAELLYINGPYSLQGEFIQTDVNAAVNDYAFESYYIQGSFFVFGTGRRFKYETSTLKGVKPLGTTIEAAFRYSYINLNDKDEAGGEQSDYNFGLNWYITKELKVMANYIVAMPKSDRYDGMAQILQARVLFAF